MNDPTAPGETAAWAAVGSDVSSEQLREALSSLARARDLADRRARENALITEVLETLLRPRPPARLIALILRRLRALLPFESALVLEPETAADPDRLRVAFAQPGHLRDTPLAAGPMLRRVIAGRVVNAVDGSAIPDFAETGLAEVLRGGVLALPIPTQEVTGILLLGSAKRGAFTAEDAALGQRLSVLGSQVQVALEAREMRARTMSLAAEKAAAERARAASERREMVIRTLLDGLPIGIYLKNPNGQYRIVNQAMDSLLGRQPGSTVGETAASIFGDEIGAGLMADTERVLSDEGRITREVSTVRDGRTHCLQVTKARVDLDGLALIAGTVLDVTEQRAAERALVAAKQAAEGANAAKTAFLATMSHEIRTPLNGVIGMIGVLSETEMAAEQARLLHAARQSAEHLLGIVNDILDMSKLEAGKFELDREPFALRMAIADVVELMRPAAQEHGNRLYLDAEIDPGLVVLGDQGRLRQILFNLIGNAIKFTQVGTIGVEAAVRPVADRPEARDRISGEPCRTLILDLAVRDTGVGIAAEKLSTIFDRFSQADTSTTRTFGGTGLGLAICKEICGLMGGDIAVESQPGKGSLFRIRVPVDVAAGVSADRKSEVTVRAPATQRPLRLLVVDDIAVNCDVLAHMLRRDGHRVDIALSGRQAVDAVSRHRYAAVLMDVQMPDMDGIAATKAIRALEGGAGTVPVVAVTASAMSGDRERFIAAGMDRYLSKPVRVAALRRVLAELSEAAAADGRPLSAEREAPPAGGSDPEDDRIDATQIAEAVDLMGPEDFAAALAMLENDLKARFERLDAALSAADLAATRPLFHAIKGSSATYGLTAVRDAAVAGERAQSVDDGRRALDRLTDALPRCLDAASRIGSR